MNGTELPAKPCEVCHEEMRPKFTTTAGNWRKKKYCGMACAMQARKVRNAERQQQKAASSA